MRSAFVILALGLAASARPMRRDATSLSNGQKAIALNATASCSTGQDACITGKFAQCVNGKFVLQSCAPGTICAAIPLDTTASNSTGSTSTGSASSTDNSSSGSAVGASNSTSTSTTTAIGSLSSSDITTNATQDDSDAQVIATGFMNNGQGKSSVSIILDVQEAGQVASLTSNNNFINYCLTQGDLPITNGLQITTGSCNPAPIGTIPAVQNMPSAKFSNPANGGTIPADTAFTITMNINNLDTGNFVNANENYFAAPQQLNSQGLIIGHTHFVIETLSDLAQTTPTDPQKFAFFKGVNTAAVNGAVSVDVTATNTSVPDGLPAGTYRLCSINSSSNHQPVIVPIAQHGSLDDCVYTNATAVTGAATASNATTSAAADVTSGKASKAGKAGKAKRFFMGRL
ncbi:hypothetical protein EV360DRAFT_92959 [Lentinula raphanica]|nr:hypothetical protein EV360DRAFT_92959 [Lentinula raphanica]